MTFVAHHPELERRAKAVFDDIVDLAADQQSEAVERACGDDAALRQRVEALLAAHAHAENFIEPPPPLFGFELGADGGIHPSTDSDDPLIGQHVARYRILRRLATGGMGVVYLAVQDQPRRQVALKVMRASLVSRSMLRRFEHEAEVLGQLRHPGIAQVHEAGTFDLGRGAQPFFAMEFIDGRTLTDFAKTHELPTAQRLELLASVCDAVHYAHQKGVVHRDLKPDNILVPESEHTKIAADRLKPACPQPKVLDFGVARLTDSDFAVTTLQTDLGQIVGTLPYMSPEQVAADPTQVDIRSDVYALGVIGFELLTGKVPLDVRHKSMAEAARIIVDHEPPSLTSFDRVFRGDLSTIIGKALEKDKTRRYQSAWELGEDLRRFLRHEPISARPATTMYQFRKFARRNKALVAGAAGVLLALVLGIIGTSIGMVKAKDAATLAESRKVAAEKSATEATKQRESALQVSRFLQQMLGSINPVTAQGRDTALLMDILESASRRVDAELAGQPDIAATLHGVIGRTYASIAEYDRAIGHLEQALAIRRRMFGPESDEIIQSAGDLGRTYMNASRIEAARPLVTEALDAAERAYGRDDARTIRAMLDMGNQRRITGDFAEAERLMREAVKHAEMSRHSDDPARIAALGELANVLLSRHKYAPARPLFEEVLASRLRSGPADGFEVGIAEFNVARILHELQDAEEKEHLDRALTIYRKVLPPGHDRIASCVMMLASFEYVRGEYDRAAELQTQAMAAAKEAFGEEHPMVARILAGMSDCAEAQQDRATAERLCVQALEMRRRTLPADHPDIAASLKQLTSFRRGPAQAQEVLALLREALAIQQVHGANDFAACETILNLGTHEYMYGDIATAEVHTRTALDMLVRLLGEDHPALPGAWNRLALMLTEQQKYDEALIWRQRCLDYSLAHNEADNEVGGNQWRLGDVLNKLNRFGEAEPILREGLRRTHAFFGDGHQGLCRVQSSLGECLTGLGQFDEAERLLLESERSWSALYPSSPQTKEMRERLAALYRATNRPNEAAHWAAAAERTRATPRSRPATAPATQPAAADNPR